MVGTLSSFEMAPRRGRVSNFGGLPAAGDPGVVPTDSNTCECVSHFCGVLRSRPASAASCVLKKTAFQLFLQRVVGMWVDFFVLACAEPEQRVGAGELFDWFERICRQRMCAFLCESKDALDPKASKQRARNGTNEPNASIRNREEACEGESRRCFRRCREHDDDPRCARRGISQGPSSSSTPCRRKLFIPGWLQF